MEFLYSFFVLEFFFLYWNLGASDSCWSDRIKLFSLFAFRMEYYENFQRNAFRQIQSTWNDIRAIFMLLTWFVGCSDFLLYVLNLDSIKRGFLFFFWITMDICYVFARITGFWIHSIPLNVKWYTKSPSPLFYSIDICLFFFSRNERGFTPCDLKSK